MKTKKAKTVFEDTAKSTRFQVESGIQGDLTVQSANIANKTETVFFLSFLPVSLFI